MTIKRDSKNNFRVTTKSGNNYIVTLTRLNNTYSGTPRYEANIINLAYTEKEFISFVYRFTGHYCGDSKEAEYIAEYHENHR